MSAASNSSGEVGGGETPCCAPRSVSVAFRDIDNLPPGWGEGACLNGQPAVGTWDEGDIVCYIDDGVAKIRWTDHRSGLYGLVDATNRNLPALVDWWRANAQRLGVADWAE